MNKKSMSGQSVVSPKTSINPNIPSFVPQTHQYLRQPPMSSMRPYMSSLGPMPPHLTLPPPTSGPIWSSMGPINPNYGYYSHQLNGHLSHSMNCCLANAYNQRTQCPNCSSHWPQNGWPNREPFDSNSNTNGIIESITEVSIDDSDNESTLHYTSNNSNNIEKKLQKEIKQLKGVNEVLKSSLEETTKQLKQTEELVLKTNEKLAIDCIEKYRQNLKRYGDYIRNECNRFYQNEAIAQRLEPIVQQITIASNKAKEEKKRVRESAQSLLKDDMNRNLESIGFDYSALPEFPDLLSFYKTILDEIPLVFLNDLNEIKRIANSFMQTKNKISDNYLTQSMPFGDDLKHHMPSVSDLFSAPKVSDLPKPNFGLIGQKDNVLPLRAVEQNSSLEMTFPRNSSPISAFNSFAKSIIGDSVNVSTPLLNSNNGNQVKNELISQSLSDSKPISAQNLQNNGLTAIGEKVQRKPIEAKETETPVKQLANVLPNSESSSSTLNVAQMKLLAKLKEKYMELSDEILIDSMSQTKSSLISSGNPKGFSGMKISDIVSKISEYIDRNVVLMNNFTQSRNSRSIPSLKIISNNKSQNQMFENTSHLEPKGWSKVDHKTGKYDDSICSICYESIAIQSKYETECNHFFHDSCISNWIKKDGSCPICRRLVLPPGEYPEL